MKFLGGQPDSIQVRGMNVKFRNTGKICEIGGVKQGLVRKFRWRDAMTLHGALHPPVRTQTGRSAHTKTNWMNPRLLRFTQNRFQQGSPARSLLNFSGDSTQGAATTGVNAASSDSISFFSA